MNRSMSFRTSVAADESGGTAGRTSGCQAQWSRRGSRSATAACRSASDSGQAAPASIHRLSMSISVAESRSPSGGIRFFSSVLPIRRISSLSLLLPATMTGPKSPPLCARCFTSSRRRFSCVSGPWQSPQRPMSSGRISRSKSMVAASLAAAGAAGGSAEATSEIAVAAIRQAPRQPFQNRGRDAMKTSIRVGRLACARCDSSIVARNRNEIDANAYVFRMSRVADTAQSHAGVFREEPRACQATAPGERAEQLLISHSRPIQWRHGRHRRMAVICRSIVELLGLSTSVACHFCGSSRPSVATLPESGPV